MCYIQALHSKKPQPHPKSLVEKKREDEKENKKGKKKKKQRELKSWF